MKNSVSIAFERLEKLHESWMETRNTTRLHVLQSFLLNFEIVLNVGTGEDLGLLLTFTKSIEGSLRKKIYPQIFRARHKLRHSRGRYVRRINRPRIA